ncbi:MAG: helix-turn-helix domain-containing protein [Gammaproteobacteria bacterium]|nr:helix-turn-helix domain-containing protein [Gammaproteobacteria bacterium]
MTEHEQQETVALESEFAAIGRRLKESRQRAGRSLEDVASELRLTVEQVSALEEAQPEKLPPGPFIRGYIRNYARIFDLHELSSAQLHLELPSSAEGGRQRLSRRGGSKSGRNMVGMLLLLLVVIALSLAGVWWLNQPLEKERDVAAESRGTEPGRSATDAPVRGLSADPLAENSAPLKRGEEIPLEESAESEDLDTLTPEEMAVEAELDAAAERAFEVAEESAQKEADAAHQLASAEGQLDLTFDSASWIKVTDANGERLSFGLKKEGQEISLQGKPPFTVLLGYAPGVEVVYNGKPFDHQSFIRKGMARFEVGLDDAE